MNHVAFGELGSQTIGEEGGLVSVSRATVEDIDNEDPFHDLEVSYGPVPPASEGRGHRMKRSVNMRHNLQWWQE
jgi:hypothetical protein